MCMLGKWEIYVIKRDEGENFVISPKLNRKIMPRLTVELKELQKLQFKKTLDCIPTLCGTYHYVSIR